MTKIDLITIALAATLSSDHVAMAQTSDYYVSSVTVSDFASSVQCDQLEITPTGSRLFFRATGNNLREMNMATKAHSSYLTNVGAFSVESNNRLIYADYAGNWGAFNLATDGYDGSDSVFTGTVFAMAAGSSMDWSIILTESGGVVTSRYKSVTSVTFSSNANPMPPLSGLTVNRNSVGTAWGCYDGQLVSFHPVSSSSVNPLFGQASSAGGEDGGQGVGEMPSTCHLRTTYNNQHMFIVSEDGHTIRHLNLATSASDRTITTIAGSHGVAGDATGSGTDARFNAPKGFGYQYLSDTEHRLFLCDFGNNKIKQVDITMSPACASRVMLAFDRTYRTKVLQSIAQGVTFLNEFVDNLVFGGALMGFYNILHHSLDEILSIDNPDAADQTAWQTLLADVKGGWKHRQTHFWTLFTTLADRVSESGTPSYILLITDGQLVRSGHWRKHLKLKRKMQRRLGSDAPTVVCVRVRTRKTSMFLEKVCDQIIYEGKDSKTLEVQAQELATSVCSGP